MAQANAAGQKNTQRVNTEKLKIEQANVGQESEVKLEESWRLALKTEFEADYIKNLKKFLVSEKVKGKLIYPRGDEIFSALNLTPLDAVKVVIIGQDPYHGPNQAHGLCFSVKPEVPPPPSLVNIYKELSADLGIKIPKAGYLANWAKQGVLLLNAVLTVEAGRANSHKDKGWERFTDKIVEILNKQKEGLVFVLWGSYAQKKGESIDRKKHFVIEAPHPSPLSAYRGFLGSKPFTKINKYLVDHGKKPIDWQL
jgi:uracil-DNA glycosylase